MASEVEKAMAAKATDAAPTPAQEWRKPREEGFNITLLSGNVATLRPVALDVLIKSGQLSDVLTDMAAQMLWEQEEKEPDDIAKKADVARGYADLINAVVPAAFLYPKVVDEPTEDDEIGLDDIEFSDKVQAFNLAISGAMVLRKFRERQVADAETESDGESNGNEAE